MICVRFVVGGGCGGLQRWTLATGAVVGVASLFKNAVLRRSDDPEVKHIMRYAFAVIDDARQRTTWLNGIYCFVAPLIYVIPILVSLFCSRNVSSTARNVTEYALGW